MDYIYLGIAVSTHGIKGEIKIISNFKYKDMVFKKGNVLYFGDSKKEFEILNYRKHKNYDMVLLSNIDSIDKASPYIKDNVYILRKDHDFNGVLDEDLIGLTVYRSTKKLGIITNVIKGLKQDIIVINDNILIPYVDEFIKKIDIKNKKVNIEIIEGLINEN